MVKEEWPEHARPFLIVSSSKFLYQAHSSLFFSLLPSPLLSHNLTTLAHPSIMQTRRRTIAIAVDSTALLKPTLDTSFKKTKAR